MGIKDNYGYGYGDGYGDGYGRGDGYGGGFGYGYSYCGGYGCSYSDGSGGSYGDSIKLKLKIPESQAWTAYHYIKKIPLSDDEFKLNHNNRIVKIGEVIHEQKIEICKFGLHASLSIEDAKRYKPNNSVLTKVLVWGEIIVSYDKVVATHRQIIECLGKE